MTSWTHQSSKKIWLTWKHLCGIISSLWSHMASPTFGCVTDLFLISVRFSDGSIIDIWIWYNFVNGLMPHQFHEEISCDKYSAYEWNKVPLLLAWIEFNPSMDKIKNMPNKVWGEITYPFPNFGGCIRWSSGMDKYIHPIICHGCNCLIILGLKTVSLS